MCFFVGGPSGIAEEERINVASFVFSRKGTRVHEQTCPCFSLACRPASRGPPPVLLKPLRGVSTVHCMWRQGY